MIVLEMLGKYELECTLRGANVAPQLRKEEAPMVPTSDVPVHYNL